ncbi:hypothetical protein Q0Z83_029070 [Actinoplanes sichuanensis]|nr:hypothetical protein Q0Z83_029070 [Actinoplanes sichuanensis]
MGQPGDGPGLPIEAVRSAAAQHLDRHIPAQTKIESPPDLGHPTAPERLQQFVPITQYAPPHRATLAQNAPHPPHLSPARA